MKTGEIRTKYLDLNSIKSCSLSAALQHSIEKGRRAAEKIIKQIDEILPSGNIKGGTRRHVTGGEYVVRELPVEFAALHFGQMELLSTLILNISFLCEFQRP